MSPKRMVALAIGVADPQGLPYLPAALNGARDFHHWAKSLGYEAALVVDDEQPVTVRRLREQLDVLLAAPAPIDRFVLYFAGHGIIREAEEGLWLLSDWRSELRGVQYEVLKRRLRMFGVRQIAIFADACRSLPADINVADLDGDAVLGQGPHPSAAMPPVDKFVATQEGAATFAVPGDVPEQDRCLFSGVLLEGLWGLNAGAFSKFRANTVTSASLSTYLQTEVPSRAQTYRCVVQPNCAVAFPEGDDVYFGDGTPPAPPPRAPWPQPRITRSARLEAAKAPSRAAVAGNELEARIRAQRVPPSFETGSGFVVEGGRVRTIWTDSYSSAGRSHEPGWFHVGARRAGGVVTLERAAPVLLELDDGTFAAVTALPNCICSVIHERGGVSGLVYRALYGSARDVDVTARALARLEGGGMRASSKTDLAVELRRDKHADPVLGVISAYLYESVGDVDSIRRMAFFYVEHEQPIPYDIALLAELPCRHQDGQLLAQVPAVARREPRTPAESQAPWTFRATPAVSGAVAGLCPWMRQGWSFLEQPSAAGGLVLPELLELAPHVARARFTTLSSEGGKRLIAAAGSSPWDVA